ncbi:MULTISPECIES: hypothetical protein [Nostocales]|uniref:Uncharacterized protein n=1 Tax=Dolichospermum flos-aquae UHCC 0037 TaxID=2590026 RepID=A0ACC7S1D1_DOLFA|nr:MULTISPECIES: hypothetical protein [Nostocales]MBO1065910.1 hypothetical protein [Anabaena sp. 54]MTJ41751.1 hypothetical protein [Dolichospermum flos-aquae UHCC 0037]
MSESKIPWPIWAAVMLACAVIAAWASRPQTDDQRVEYLQRKISSLEAQLNRQQPTYSPSVSEPSPSPKAIPAPTPTITTEPTPSLSDPKWDYSVFNSSSVGDYAVFSYKMIEEPAFNQQNQQVEWIIEFSIPPEAERSPAAREAYLRLELLQHGFRAKFIDSSGVFLGAKNLDKEGQGGYRRRYTLRVPNSIWEKWSKVSQVIIEKQ